MYLVLFVSHKHILYALIHSIHILLKYIFLFDTMASSNTVAYIVFA